MTRAAPRIVNNVSYVMWINHESHFAWQVQHLVMSDTPGIVNNVSSVIRINHESDFAWQVQHLVKFKRHFSWQVQHLVKFGMIAGARNVVFFITKCSW